MSSIPVRLDPHQEKRVQLETIKSYQSAGADFADWLLLVGWHPTGPDDWDDALIEYKNVMSVRKAKFAHTVSAVEFFFVRYKGHLCLSHTVLAGMSVVEETKHTVPLGYRPAALMATHMVVRIKARMALGMMLQVVTGLRPTEMLHIEAGHISLPSDVGSCLEKTPMVIALEPKVGTKVKRPQTVRVTSKHPELVRLVALCRGATKDNQRMFPYPIEAYRKEIKHLDSFLGFSAGWGPHSPRAGYASDAVLQGTPFEEIREGGRWSADQSLRTYLDIVSSMATLQRAQHRGLAEALEWAGLYWPSFFSKVVW